MSKISQWIANSLFALSCLFLPWKNLDAPFGGHTSLGGHFMGYYFLFFPPDKLALDSLVFLLQLALIGMIILWTETLLRSNIENSRRKYIGATLAVAFLLIIFPPIGEATQIPGTMGEIEDVVKAFGFLFTNGGSIIPKYAIMELIALFGLSTLAIKYFQKPMLEDSTLMVHSN